MKKTILLWILALIILSTAAFADLDSELIHAYNFDGDCTDTVGSWDCTVNGADFAALGPDGNNIVRFDNQGTPEWVDYNDFRPGNLLWNVTICGLFNSSDTGTGLFNKGDSSVNPGWELYANGNLNFNEDGSADIAGGTFTANQWELVCIQRNSSGVALWNDDTLVGTTADAPSTTADDFRLGINPALAGAWSLLGGVRFVYVWNESLTGTEISDLYNSGSYDYCTGDPCAFSPPADSTAPVVTMVYPVNNTRYNSYNGTFAFTLNEAGNASLNDTRWDAVAGNGSIFNFINNTPITAEQKYDVLVYAWDDEGTPNNASTFVTFTIDSTEPTIESSHSNNDTVIFPTNTTLGGWVNVTDLGGQLFGLNITIDDSIVIFNTTSLTGEVYQYNLSYNTSTLTPGIHYLNIFASDSHTQADIGTYQVKKDKNKKQLEYTDKGTNVKVYPLEEEKFYDIDTYKTKPDRYNFLFYKSELPSAMETFVVKSNKYIHIIEESSYKGHLVTGSGDSWNWIDFENADGATAIVTRISNKEVRVTLIGLTSPTIEFNSIGGLNINNKDYSFFVVNTTEVYDTDVLSGQQTTFYLNLTYNASYVNNYTAALYYNNTPYTATWANLTTQIQFSTTLTAPTVAPNSSSIPFYWNYNYSTNTFNTTEKTQNVSVSQLDNCTDFSTYALNFTIRNETSNDLVLANTNLHITATYPFGTQDYNLSFNNLNNFSICLNPPSASATIDLQAEYVASGFDKKLYYLDDLIINSTTQVVDLYLTSGTTQVKLLVNDFNDDPVAGAIIKVLSYDVGTNSYIITETLKTDDLEGAAYAQMILNTQFYQFIIEVDGVTRFFSEPTLITTTARTFRINLETDYFSRYEDYRNITWGLYFTNSSKTFTLIYNDPTESISQGCLQIERQGPRGSTVVNQTCVASTGSTIELILTEAVGNNNYLATAYVTYSDGELFTLGTIQATFNEAYKKYGVEGLLLGFFVMMVLALIGLWNPIVSVILMGVGMLFMIIMNLIQFSWPVMAAAGVVLGVAIYKLNRKG